MGMKGINGMNGIDGLCDFRATVSRATNHWQA